MLSILFPLFSAARLPLVRAQDPQPPMANISDPVGVVQCLPYTFTWTGGVPSYDVSVYSETGTSLFSATVNSTNVTWIPVNGVGATADVPVSFNVIIQDHSLYSESMSSYENITAGSIAVDSSGRCQNAPPVSISTTAASVFTAPVSPIGSGTKSFVPTTIKGSVQTSVPTNSAAVGSTISGSVAAASGSSGGVPAKHSGSLTLGAILGGVSLLVWW